MPDHSITDDHIKKATDVLKNGGVVVFPTETAYGLAADATNSVAVEKVNAIKGRAHAMTPPLIVSDVNMAQKYVELSLELLGLTKQFWPGALTVVGRAKDQGYLSPLVIREDGTIAIRVSSHPVAKQLSEMLGKPIVATSANLFENESCYSVASVKYQLEHQSVKPDMYLDDGILSGQKPSTIVKEEDGKIVVIREGEIEIPKSIVIAKPVIARKE